MTTFIALLRGVNVGKTKRVPMAAWRELLAGLGYSDVATLLNSGNAVFGAAKGTPVVHAAAIRAAISSELQVDVPVIVKSAKELAAIVAGNPFAATCAEPSRLLVAFAPDRAALMSLAPLGALAAAPERFAIGAHAAYLECPEGILQSKVGEAMLGKVGRQATSRNWATVLKLQALVAEVNRRVR